MIDPDNIVLHPELARLIARHIVNRGLAGEMVQTMLLKRGFKQADYDYWRNEHIEASAALRKLGINVGSYDTNSLKGIIP